MMSTVSAPANGLPARTLTTPAAIGLKSTDPDAKCELRRPIADQLRIGAAAPLQTGNKGTQEHLVEKELAG